MDRFLEIIDRYDLSSLHMLSCIAGVFLSVYVMSITGHSHVDRYDSPALQWFRRFGYFVTASAMLWVLAYMTDKAWHPWPPCVLLTIGVDINLLVRAFAIHGEIKRCAKCTSEMTGALKGAPVKVKGLHF